MSERTERRSDETPLVSEEATPRGGDGNETVERGDVEASPSIEAERFEGHPVDIDQVFEILKNERRRNVLRYVRTVDGEVELGDLAERIAAWECDKPVEQITSGERKRVYVGLYQSHLPKMDDVSAISYNKPRGRIGRGENIAIFEHYLPAEEDPSDRRWTRYHSALSLIAVVYVLSLALLGATGPVAAVQLIVASLIGGLLALPLLSLRE